MRRFEFVGGTSAKFWMCSVEGSTFIVVYGRLGTDGQRKEKEFDDDEEAEAEMAKKIAEKLKEGYAEVAADAATKAAPGKKGADAAAPKLSLPTRFKRTRAGAASDAGLLKAAATALKALARSTTARSWRREMAAKEARRALRRLGGVDVNAAAAVGEAFDAVVDAAIAKPALPLRFVLAVLDEVQPSGLDRAIARWAAPAGPNGAAIKAVKGVHVAVGGVADAGGAIDDVAVRVAVALVDHGCADAAAVARFKAVKPFVEAAAAKGGGLAKWLAALDDGGDVVAARRKSLFASA